MTPDNTFERELPTTFAGRLPASSPGTAAPRADAGTRPATLRTLLVSDVRLYREALAYCLHNRTNIVDVVAIAAKLSGALAAARELRPELVLLDMTMADSVGTARALTAHVPEARIVALSVTESEREIVACAEAGVVGYVECDGSMDELVRTMQSAARGELRCSPRVATALLGRLRARASELAESGAPPARLTARERQVLKLVDEGLSNKEIAGRLGLGITTVKNHVHNILEKLQVHQRGKAAALLHREEPVRLSRREVPIVKF